MPGGQQQRAAIAMAFACRPSLIVLGEPTIGLDVSTQRHILDTVSFDGAVLANAARRRPIQAVRQIQCVFQNPYTALNPRKTLLRRLQREHSRPPQSSPRPPSGLPRC